MNILSSFPVMGPSTCPVWQFQHKSSGRPPIITDYGSEKITQASGYLVWGRFCLLFIVFEYTVILLI